MPKIKKLKESDIQATILAWLQTAGVLAWRMNAGAMPVVAPNGSRRYVRFGPKGIPDIVGILPDGRMLAIEVKRPKGKPRAEQLRFIDRINTMGGLAFVARSVADVKQALQAEGVLDGER